MPSDTEISSNRVYVKTAPNVQASPRQGPWTIADSETGRVGPRSGLLLTAAGPRRRKSASMCVGKNPRPLGAMFVDRAWMQSWLTNSARQDRAVFQIVTRRKELEATLPAGAAVRQMSVLLDGQKVEYRLLAEDRLSIPLSSRRRATPLRAGNAVSLSRCASRRAGVLSLEFPRLGSGCLDASAVLATRAAAQRTRDRQARRIHQRILLGLARLLLGSSAVARPGAIGVVGWRDAGEPRCRKAAASTCISTLGNVDRAELRTAGRSWIVLLASGAALLVGLVADLRAGQPSSGGIVGFGLGIARRRRDRPRADAAVRAGRQPGIGVDAGGRFARSEESRGGRLPTKIPESSHSRLELGSARLPPRSVGGRQSVVDANDACRCAARHKECRDMSLPGGVASVDDLAALDWDSNAGSAASRRKTPARDCDSAASWRREPHARLAAWRRQVSSRGRRKLRSAVGRRAKPGLRPPRAAGRHRDRGEIPGQTGRAIG